MTTTQPGNVAGHDLGRDPGWDAPREPSHAGADEGRVGVLGAAWRYKWLVVLVTLLVTALVVGLSLLVAGKPSGTIKLALSNATENNLLVPGTIGDSAVTRYVSQRADFLTSDELLTAVQDAGFDESLEDLKDDISVSTTTGSNVLDVTVSGDDAAAVTELSQTLVEVYRQMTLDTVQTKAQAALATIDADIRASIRELRAGNAKADAAAQSLVELRTQAATIRIDTSSFGDGVDWASIPSEEEVDTPAPSPRDAAVGFVLGLMLSFFLAWVLADSRRVLRSPGHASQLLGAPVLGSIPRRSGRRAPSPVVASLALASRTRPGAVVVLDAGAAGRGGGGRSAQVSGVLAAGLAQQGRSVLLVDQASRKGGGVGRVAEGAPLSDVLVESQLNGTTVATVGASDRLAELGSGPDAVRSTLQRLTSSFEWVVLEAGAWGDAAGVAFVVAQADAVVVVADRGGREADAARLGEALEALGVPLTGVVYVGG